MKTRSLQTRGRDFCDRRLAGKHLFRIPHSAIQPQNLITFTYKPLKGGLIFIKNQTEREKQQKSNLDKLDLIMSGLPETQYAHDEQPEKKQKNKGRPKKEQKPAEKKPEPRPQPIPQPKPEQPKTRKPEPPKAPVKAPEPPKAAQAPAAAPEQSVLDDNARRITEFLTGLLEHMDSNAVPHCWKDEGNTYKVDLVGDDLGYLIGRRGDTLDAIQHLTNYTINRDVEGHIRVNVDAECYREKREESLRRYARKKAQQVLKARRRTTLEPMNAYERHVIHAALQDMENITTHSTGVEPNRRVVIEYVR